MFGVVNALYDYSVFQPTPDSNRKQRSYTVEATEKSVDKTNEKFSTELL